MFVKKLANNEKEKPHHPSHKPYENGSQKRKKKKK
jgi:hypothetical protein